MVSTHKDDDGDDATQEKKTSNNNNNNNNNKSCGCEAFFAHCAAQSYDGLFRELRPSYIYWDQYSLPTPSREIFARGFRKS